MKNLILNKEEDLEFYQEILAEDQKDRDYLAKDHKNQQKYETAQSFFIGSGFALLFYIFLLSSKIQDDTKLKIAFAIGGIGLSIAATTKLGFFLKDFFITRKEIKQKIEKNLQRSQEIEEIIAELSKTAKNP